MKKKLFIFSNESISIEDNKYFCDNLHKTLEGEMVQANIIYDKLNSYSKFFKWKKY